MCEPRCVTVHDRVPVVAEQAGVPSMLIVNDVTPDASSARSWKVAVRPTWLPSVAFTNPTVGGTVSAGGGGTGGHAAVDPETVDIGERFPDAS